MEPVVVASNRGPLSFRMDDNGQPIPTGPAGGLAATLEPLLRNSGSLWVAASMSEADLLASERGLMEGEGITVVNVRPAQDVYTMAYDVISNATLWFCLHHLWDLSRRPRFDARWWEAWEAYRQVNAMFAELVAREAPPDVTVLVQDYHLLLMGGLLAEARPDVRTVHFSHTPWCAPDFLRAMPSDAAAEVLAGMAGYGVCGFHTHRWEAAFRQSYGDPGLTGGRSTAPPPTFVSPLAPVPETIRAEASSAACQEARRSLREHVGDRHLIVRVDRVELSKNILRGCWAIEELLAAQPELRGRFVLLTLAYPSREGLPEYLAYRSEIEHTVQRINETWGESDWAPIELDVADNRNRSLAALCEYDSLLVNPVRDGMNLVAKEGPIINGRDGVVVLSREAGAFEELADLVVPVNPFDVGETATALDTAIDMSVDERRARAAALRKAVTARTAADWLDEQVEAGRSVRC